MQYKSRDDHGQSTYELDSKICIFTHIKNQIKSLNKLHNDRAHNSGQLTLCKNSD